MIKRRAREKEEMLGTIYKNWVPRKQRRKRRVLDKIRRQFANCGYSLEDLTDAQLEAAITFDGGRIEDAMPLTGKRTYWILRRLSPDAKQLRGRRIELAPSRQELLQPNIAEE